MSLPSDNQPFRWSPTANGADFNVMDLLNFDGHPETPNFLRELDGAFDTSTGPEPSTIDPSLSSTYQPGDDSDPDSSLSDAPDVDSPSQISTARVDHPLDEPISLPEQQTLPPAIQPDIQVHAAFPNGHPAGNWFNNQPNNQPNRDWFNNQPNGQAGFYAQPYAQPYAPYMQQYAAPGQNFQASPWGLQPGMAYGPPPVAFPGHPNPAHVGNGGQGEFANQPVNAGPDALGIDNNSQDVSMMDAAAEDNDNLEYITASGDVFKGSDVRYNPSRGYFIPVTQRRKDEVPKRSGPRPGTKDEPLYELCKWTRGNKDEDSDCLGINVYGDIYDRPSDWQLPNNLGMIRYNKEGSMPDGFTLTARQLRAYVDSCPRNLRLMIANAPSQATHRLMAKECIWDCCPNNKRNMRQGFHQVIFDEYPDQTDIGDRDPFRIAGRMHLWCYEQCCDLVEDFKRGIVRPETRVLLREQKNVMALDRDCNTTVERDTYEPWFRYHIQSGEGPVTESRPFKQSLAYCLNKHHLKGQAARRQRMRDERNAAVKHDPKSIDKHKGDLHLYHVRDQSTSNDFLRRDNCPDEVFQPSVPVPNFRLPEHFGSRAAKGGGCVLDKSLIRRDGKQNGRKRSHDDVSSSDSPVSSESSGSGQSTEEPPQRPIKRARTAGKTVAPSPRHGYGTRANR